MARRVMFVLSFCLVACGGDGEEPPRGLVAVSPDPRRNVLLVDDGFDPEAALLRGKVAGLYTIVCQREPEAEADAGAPSDGAPEDGGADAGPPEAGASADPSDAAARFEQAKAEWLAYFRTKRDDCRLQPGITPKPDPLAHVARHRDAFNKALREDRYPGDVLTKQQLAEISGAFENDLPKVRMHGTATASVVAHDNPGVRLVLVEEKLGDWTKIREEFVCLEQEDIDLSIALLLDPEIQQGYADQPPSVLHDELRELRVRHNVGLMNESFGQMSRLALEELQRMKGCPTVELKRYFELNGRIEEGRAKVRRDESVLLVKSAGNDHSQIDSAADDAECAPSEHPRLLVGAYEVNGRPTDFTNWGECVDVFAPGADLIVGIYGGWLAVWSGTSFAAPLVARLISLEAPQPFTAATARRLATGARDGRDRIHVSRFPASILFDPEREARHWALTVDGQLPFGPSAAPRITPRMLRDALWPLRLLRRR